MKSSFYESEHQDYREIVREYLKREVAPNYEFWEAERAVDREAWVQAAKVGAVGLQIPEAYGGAGVSDFRFRMVLNEEIAAGGYASFGASLSVQDDVVLPYLLDLCNDEQKSRWLPRMAAGELIGAIAITEPGAGSDMQGIRTSAVQDGDGWILNGSKTFISSGYLADLVIVVARSDPSAGSRGFSLFVVEAGVSGFGRGRKLLKVGLHAQDTAELSFEEVRVGSANVLGDIGGGMTYLMQRLAKERLSIASTAIASSQAALNWTLDYVFQRQAFGKRIGDFQNTRFVLAELETKIDVTLAYVQNCAIALNEGDLSAVDAAKAKWWASELQQEVTNRCLQLFGGYGFMLEYPIARAYLDARIQTIYGGTTEIMKEIIGRDQAGRHDR